MSIADTIVRDVSLASHTTIGLGGVAAHYIAVHDTAELREALEYARTNTIPVHILAGGSNTIFADEGFAGLVIHIQLKGLEFSEAEDDRVIVTAAAGEVWDDVVVRTIEQNLTGFEAMSGIPGCVGATPIQNVGAYGQEVAGLITEVTAIDRATGEEVTFKGDECGFGYRTSRFKEADREAFVITSVSYALQRGQAPQVTYPQLAAAAGPSPSIQDVRDAVLDLRTGKSMVVRSEDPHSKSCGSFFVNPIIPKELLTTLQEKYPDIPYFTGEETASGTSAADWTEHSVKIPAAWLIEHAGFTKGFRQDGVGISPNHPLALVNYGGTTTQLLALARSISDAVQSTFDISLVREPVVVESTA